MARAFPREDCGGVHGHERCVRLATGKWNAEVGDEVEPRGLRGWLEDWRPEHCDLEAAEAEFDS